MQRKKIKFTSKFLSSLTHRIHWNPALHCHPHQFLCAMFLLHHQRDSNFKENFLINSNAIDLYLRILFTKYCQAQAPNPKTQKLKTEEPWADTKISWVTHHPTTKVQSGPEKKLRWTVRGRTWSSPPCSVRTSSILLVASLSKYKMPAFIVSSKSATLQRFLVKCAPGGNIFFLLFSLLASAERSER